MVSWYYGQVVQDPLRYKYGPAKTKIVVFYSLSNAFDLTS